MRLPIVAAAVAVSLFSLGAGIALAQQKGATPAPQAGPQSRFPPKAVAGSQQPDWRAEPRYATLNLSVGFEPDPRTVEVDAGGDRQVDGLGPNCTGWIDFSRPDVDLNYAPTQGQQYPLYISAVSQADTTIVINDPQGRWHCNDDFEGLNPGVVFQQPLHGNYNIWIGTLAGGPTQRATVRISEILPRR
jgi:serine protease Do